MGLENIVPGMPVERILREFQEAIKTLEDSVGGENLYIGKEYGGGVIFHLWEEEDGQHGLVVDKFATSDRAWSNVTGTIVGTSRFDGLANSIAIVEQAGHDEFDSAAASCLALNIDGFNDWYLPSLDELSLLFTNAFDVNRALYEIGEGSFLTIDEYYWSSTESGNDAMYINGVNSVPYLSNKSQEYAVRAIRRF